MLLKAVEVMDEIFIYYSLHGEQYDQEPAGEVGHYTSLDIDDIGEVLVGSYFQFFHHCLL